MPSKRVIQAALTVVKPGPQTYPANASRKELAVLGYGKIVGRQYLITRDDREKLRTWLAREGISWDLPAAAYGTGHREDTAAQSIHEKHAHRTAQGKRVLLQPLATGIFINGQEIPVLSLQDACLSVSPDAITTLDADALLVVENSRAFHRLRDQRLTDSHNRWLAVYRGDPQHASGQTWARDIAQRQQVRLFAYTDFDPAGMIIALGMEAEQMLLPNLEDMAGLAGSEPDFDRQQTQWTQLQSSVPANSALAPWVDHLRKHKAGFTQERMLAAGVALETVPVEPSP